MHIPHGGDGLVYQPFVLKAVREAEKKILEANHNHEYAGIEGIVQLLLSLCCAPFLLRGALCSYTSCSMDAGVPEFVDQALQFAYGADNPAIADKRIAAVQVGTVLVSNTKAWWLMMTNGSSDLVITPCCAVNHRPFLALVRTVWRESFTRGLPPKVLPSMSLTPLGE